jgi:hypothetical protein
LVASTAELYDISRATLFRLLRGERRPKDAHRADRGLSRTMPAYEIEWWCEVVAAMKSRTTNRQGRRLSTKRILEIVTEHGVETPDCGLVKLPPGRLAASTLNRHMRQRGYRRYAGSRTAALTARVRDLALLSEYLASVAPNVICVSMNVRPPIASVPHNPSGKAPSIAVPGDHHCEPLQVGSNSLGEPSHALQELHSTDCPN